MSGSEDESESDQEIENDDFVEEYWNSRTEGYMTLANARRFLTKETVNDSMGSWSIVAMMISDNPGVAPSEIINQCLGFGFDINIVAMGNDEVGPRDRFRSEATLLHREMLPFSSISLMDGSFTNEWDDRCVESLKTLLSFSIRPDLKDSYGDTPLCVAAHWFKTIPKFSARFYLKAVEVLFEHGARISRISSDVKIPVEFNALYYRAYKKAQAAALTFFGIWLHRRNDCCDTMKLLDKHVAKIITRMIWETKLDSIWWFGSPYPHQQTKKLKK